eukprot:3425545-Prymnesium_polylepis.1
MAAACGARRLDSASAHAKDEKVAQQDTALGRRAAPRHAVRRQPRQPPRDHRRSVCAKFRVVAALT